MPDKKEITAIILAGGKSSRMMQDKGLIIFQNKMMITHVIDIIKKITNNIIIITLNPDYRQFGYPCFSDSFKNSGPLSGIYTGLINSSTKKNLVLGCDMPFLSEKILNALIDKTNDEDALITEHNGNAEPLFAVYDKSCIAEFNILLNEGKLKITDALKNLKTIMINFDKESWFKGNEFANINSPEELLKYENLNNQDNIL